MKQIFIGADVLVQALEDLGVRCVFGLPGTQNVELFESLRRSGIRTVLATSETAAGFMANGWYRASGEPGVFLGIAGPGFAWAVPPLAEAALDSSAVILITPKPPERSYRHDLQVIAQGEIAASLDCEVFTIDESAELIATLGQAWAAARARGPRPVVLQVAPDAVNDDVSNPAGLRTVVPGSAVQGKVWPTEIVDVIAEAERPLILAGGGTLDYSRPLTELAETIGAAIVTTPTARGVVREDHPLCLRADLLSDNTRILNEVLEAADLVIALGCRFSHNGTGGFGLRIAKEKLVHVDLDEAVLGANYPARWEICADVGDFFSEIAANLETKLSPDRQQTAIAEVRQKLAESRRSVSSEPLWAGQGDCETLFRKIREGIPDKGLLVTDTGLHQILTRTHYDVLDSRGLIVPTDFQSMGFGLPAALGGALAAPERPVTALIGDGSLLMVGGELATAVREAVSLPVIVFRDGYLGQIRMQQLENYGYASATDLQSFDLESYATSLGAKYILGDASLAEQLRDARQHNGPTVIEIRLEDGESLSDLTRRVRRKSAVKSAIGPGVLRLLRRLR